MGGVLRGFCGGLALAARVGMAAGIAASPPCFEYLSAHLGRSVGYCVDRSRPEQPARPNEPVVYFFHGALMDSRHWFDMGYSVSLHDMASKDPSFPSFTVVSFDTHPLSFFSDRRGDAKGPFAFETWFLEEFLPFTQERLGVCGERSCRGLLGTSMGGFGAIKTALRHPDLFSFAGGVASAILPAPFYSRTRNEWIEYFRGKTVGPLIGGIYVDDLKDIFPTPELADANDPALLVDGWDESRPWPSLFFGAGGKDEFGFFDGFERMKESLAGKALAAEFVFDPEAHHFQVGGLREASLSFIGKYVRTR